MYTNEQLNAIHYSNVGIEFEFFSDYDLKKTKSELSNLFGKNIKIDEIDNFTPTLDAWTLDNNILGGTKMFKLVTSFLPYAESKLVIAKMFKWIKNNGFTSDNCSIFINVSFNETKLSNIAKISKLDIGKFVLNFNEKLVYDTFPNRENSIYAKSIKFILPLGGMTLPSTANVIWKNYMFVKDRYYGVNFLKINDDCLEFRYLGGKDYESKYGEVINMINLFITSTYNTLINPKYTEDDKKELKKILKYHEKIVKSYKSYQDFKKNFSDIRILIDLNTMDQVIELYYPKIRDVIFELLTKADMKTGLINYDSDLGKIQVKDTELLRCFEIKDVDIFDSKIRGNIIDCDIFNCEIESSYVTKSNLFGSTEIKNSKIKNSYVNKNVVCEDSYVFGEMTVFSGEMTGGVFKEGRVTKFARFDKTNVVKSEKI